MPAQYAPHARRKPRVIVPNMVCDISYMCRPLGYDPDDRESGTTRAFWTGEIDTWGKYTIRSIDGSPTLYLFADEITDVASITPADWTD